MKYSKKTNQLNFKKSWLTVLRVFLLVFAFSNIACTTDNSIIHQNPENPENPNNIANLNLEFVLRTQQDQMGDFTNNAMALFNNVVWSFGGSNDYVPEGDSTGALWNSTNGVNWATTDTSGSLTALGRSEHTLSVFNGKMYLIGGKDNSDNLLSDIWETTNGTNWTNTTASAAFGTISGHNTVVHNGKFFIIAANHATSGTMVWSTTNGTDWTQETSDAFPALKHYKTVVKNNKMYVIGGEKITGILTNEIWESTNGSQWTLISQTDTTLPALNKHTTTVFNNNVIVIGGITNTTDYTNDMYFSSDLVTWTKYNQVSPVQEINSHCSLVYNDALWVFGGYRGSPGRTGYIWEIQSF